MITCDYYEYYEYRLFVKTCQTIVIGHEYFLVSRQLLTCSVSLIEYNLLRAIVLNKKAEVKKKTITDLLYCFMSIMFTYARVIKPV